MGLINQAPTENKALRVNQAPTEDKPNAYVRIIKSFQFIYIFKKVGLMNQTPTEEESLQTNQTHT